MINWREQSITPTMVGTIVRKNKNSWFCIWPYLLVSLFALLFYPPLPAIQRRSTQFCIFCTNYINHRIMRGLIKQFIFSIGIRGSSLYFVDEKCLKSPKLLLSIQCLVSKFLYQRNRRVITIKRSWGYIHKTNYK